MLKKSPQERLLMGASMHDFSKKLVKSSILEKNPKITPSDLLAQLFLRFYGNDYDPIQREKIVDYLTRNVSKKSTPSR